MDVLSIAAGICIATVGATDVFLTVLDYERTGLLAIRAYRMVWRIGRLLVSPLPSRRRARAESLFGPIMVVLNLAGWLLFQVVGFALIYLPAVSGRGFAIGRTPHTFLGALSFSAGTLTSLSFSDVEPARLAYHGVAALETLIGLGIMTLAISYLLNLYRVLQDEGVLSSWILYHSAGGNEPLVLVERHISGVHTGDLSALLRDLSRELTAYHEGLRRYPVVWYFNTRRPYRSLPYIFWTTAAVAAALQWGLPEGADARRDPWLPGLIEGFDHIVDDLVRSFLTVPPREVEPPEPLRVFQVAVGGGPAPELLARFLEVERRVCSAARTVPEQGVDRRYRRYVAWAGFVGRAMAFVEAAGHDLGLDPEVLYANPRDLRY